MLSVLSAFLLLVVFVAAAIFALHCRGNLERIAIGIVPWPLDARRPATLGLDHLWRGPLFRLFGSLFILRRAFRFVAHFIARAFGFAGLSFANRALGFGTPRHHLFVDRYVLRELVVRPVLQ